MCREIYCVKILTNSYSGRNIDSAFRSTYFNKKEQTESRCPGKNRKCSFLRLR